MWLILYVRRGIQSQSIILCVRNIWVDHQSNKNKIDFVEKVLITVCLDVMVRFN